MRRTILSALALACTAVLAAGAPASADTPAPSRPETARTAPADPATRPAPAESEPAKEDTRRPAEESAPAPRPEPTRAPERDQVGVVPDGAPNTGVPAASGTTGSESALVGGGAAALLAGGAAAFVVRRRRATGA
ncbi:Tat pathway signal sequence domain protein [Streptomyces zingiberis]|uniref:Tat pathway signal sequence domain protein n=1 Tax=Streptomyces zingiberis TaxID=2053010 RepID=A0ABX1BNS6_9ACTN|nr:Tat pathway signal sequence domain protein [Streptomyces zingiberis]NJP99340.1 Tat pathway signal sequence domain protein [Streptomyces zingiberis]